MLRLTKYARWRKPPIQCELVPGQIERSAPILRPRLLYTHFMTTAAPSTHNRLCVTSGYPRAWMGIVAELCGHIWNSPVRCKYLNTKRSLDSRYEELNLTTPPPRRWRWLYWRHPSQIHLPASTTIHPEWGQRERHSLICLAGCLVDRPGLIVSSPQSHDLFVIIIESD